LPLLLAALTLPAAGQAPPPSALPSEAQVVDRVVAVVGDRIITASDVRLEATLGARDPSPVDMLRRRQQTAPEEMLIDAAVVRNLAGDIAIYAPSTTDVQQRLAALRATWPDDVSWESFLALHGMTTERLAGRLYSRLVVEAYVFRSVGLAAQTAGESPAAADARYRDWIAAERARVDLRRVDPMEAP
jgi:hypothetical protein